MLLPGPSDREDWLPCMDPRLLRACIRLGRLFSVEHDWFSPRRLVTWSGFEPAVGSAKRRISHLESTERRFHEVNK